jgi:trk system potassium uptake protein TrkA
MRRIAVLGLGRFGMRLAAELGAVPGVEVVAADSNGRLVDEVRDRVSVAVRMDTTDEEAMQAQNIGSMDVVVIAIGQSLEAALLTTLIAKKLGCRRVIARAQTAVQADILRRVGADEVVQIESEAGQRWARMLANPRLEDFIELDPEHSIIQLVAPESFHGKTLVELHLRTRYAVNLVAIKRPARPDAPGGPVKEQAICVPSPNDVVRPGDVLVLVGRQAALDALPGR